jgi:dihydrofolate synthase/folylpolyglutamate synthase
VTRLADAPLIDRLLALERFGIKLGLENVSRLCGDLGHPERSFASLHVAGTNGKGSVTAMAHAALVAGGLRAARYTSPHLSALAERFVIGGEMVAPPVLDAVVEDVLDRADRMRAEGRLSVLPTFFEATTTVAFELFRRASIEVAVIEVGLGGRFDATNIIAPAAGAITTIGFDHQQHLGHTLEAIAFEKAGIIKPGMTVVAGGLPEVALRVVRRAAEERGARLVEAVRDVRVEGDMIDGRARITMATPHRSYGPVTLALRGEHQIANAAVATRLLEVAAERGLETTRDAVEHGLATADWPARLERIRLDRGRHVLLDAAHNVEGARALGSYLARWHPERPPLVVGIMRDKDVDEILSVLVPFVSAVTATAAPTARALAPGDLALRARAAGAVAVTADADPVRAVERALGDADTVCVAGSIFLAGAVRDVLGRRAILR